MTLTVRLDPRVEQKLAQYCVKRRITKSEAVKQALEEFLRSDETRGSGVDHPFVGGDKGDGSDVSGSIKTLLRSRFRKRPA